MAIKHLNPIRQAPDGIKDQASKIYNLTLTVLKNVVNIITNSIE